MAGTQRPYFGRLCTAANVRQRERAFGEFVHLHILKPPPQLLIRRIKPVIYHSISEAYHGSVIPVPISKSIGTAAGAAWSTPCIAYLLLCHAFRNSVAVPHFIIVIATIFSNLLSFIIQSKFYFLSIFCRLNIKFDCFFIIFDFFLVLFCSYRSLKNCSFRRTF